MTHTLRVDKTTVHFSVGFYQDGRVGELFIDLHKFGSALRDWIGKSAQLFSVMLQHNIALRTACEQFVGVEMEPNGPVTGTHCMSSCTSIMDAIARLILCEYADSAANLTMLASYASDATRSIQN